LEEENRERNMKEGGCRGCTGKEKRVSRRIGAQPRLVQIKCLCHPWKKHENAIKAIRRLLLMPSLATDTIGCYEIFLGCGLRRTRQPWRVSPGPRASLPCSAAGTRIAEHQTAVRAKICVTRLICPSGDSRQRMNCNLQYLCCESIFD
jgi:hypothetical protein